MHVTVVTAEDPSPAGCLLERRQGLSAQFVMQVKESLAGSCLQKLWQLVSNCVLAHTGRALQQVQIGKGGGACFSVYFPSTQQRCLFPCAALAKATVIIFCSAG